MSYFGIVYIINSPASDKMTNESTPSFIMGILIFSSLFLLIFPMMLNMFLINPNNIENNQIETTIKENTIFVENKEENKTEINAISIVNTLKALFTFNAESYGLPPVTSLVASLTISIIFYSAILALASVYWPLFIIAGIAAFVQGISFFR